MLVRNLYSNARVLLSLGGSALFTFYNTLCSVLVVIIIHLVIQCLLVSCMSFNWWLLLLVHQCTCYYNLTYFIDNELLQNSDFPHIKLHPNPLIGINEEIKHVLSPFYSDFLIREALIALKEMDSSTVLVVVDALVYVAYNLPHFSDSLIHQIRYQIDTSPGNELRGITKLTVQLLVSNNYYSVMFTSISVLPSLYFISLYIVKSYSYCWLNLF